MIVKEIVVDNTTATTPCSNTKGFPSSVPTNPADELDAIAKGRQPVPGKTFSPNANENHG